MLTRLPGTREPLAAVVRRHASARCALRATSNAQLENGRHDAQSVDRSDVCSAKQTKNHLPPHPIVTMVSTRSGDAHQAETNATSAAAAAAAAAARNDDDFVDADDNHQDSAQPEQAAADHGTRAAPPRRAASPRPAGRGNRGRSQRRGGSAPPSRNQSPQQQQRRHQQPPRQNPTSNTSYDITNHERGEVRRMLIRNPPPSFEPTQAWFAAMYANLKLTGIEALARVRFTGENLTSLASILHSTIQAACASSPEA